MARTNLHDLANRLLSALDQAAADGVFEGKLREVSAAAGLNSVRSAEAIKLLEELGRIGVVQRGRRGRDTIIEIRSTDTISLRDAESMLPSRGARRTGRLTYEELGQAVVDRLLELARDDGLRTAQVEAFASQGEQLTERIKELESALEEAAQRETDLRIKLKGAEEALSRAEENIRRALGPARTPSQDGSGPGPQRLDDEESQAVLDILRSGRS